MNNLGTNIPEQWRGLISLIALPILWFLPLQSYLIHFVWFSDIWGLGILRRIFLLMPVMCSIVGLWCTMLSVYTLPFRSNRTHVVGMFLVLWWDVARSTWLFWAGMGRFLFVAFGTFWGLLRLVVAILMELLKEIVGLPFALTGVLTKNLRQPGVPWIAFLMTVAWSAIEAVIFSYILTPTFSEVVSDLVGAESHRYLSLFLGVVLFFMIAGSFACLHVLVEAIRAKDVKQIIQMIVVELFVMFVEVMFLYRELIDSLSPWIAQQTGIQMGIIPVICFASFAWMGVRGMVWFLFGRFGTPTLLAFISRQRLSEEVNSRASVGEAEERWTALSQKIKREQEWFVERANELLEAAVLPVFQVIAAALNFCTVLILSKPLFNLPFRNLAEIKETKTLLQTVTVIGESK
jgi:hypothetical protein